MDSLNFVLVLALVCACAVLVEVFLAYQKRHRGVPAKKSGSLLLMLAASISIIALMAANYEQFSGNSSKALQSSLLDVEEATEESGSFQPDFLQQKIYENEVFGSTINKVLVSKTFYFDATYENTAQSLLVENPDKPEGKALFLPTSSRKLLFRSPLNQYNQVAGKYAVTFLVKSDTPANIQQSELLGEVLILGPHTRNLITSQKLEIKESSAGFQALSVEYEQNHTGSAPIIEFWHSGEQSIWLQRVEINKVDDQEINPNINDIFPDVADWDASEGTSRFADPSEHLEGHMLFGPYDKDIPNGNYKAMFRLKTDNDKVNAPIVRIEAASLKEGTVQQDTLFKDLKGTDFSIAQKYEYFELPVRKEEDRFLEYRVYFYDLSKVWVDHVLLVPLKTKYNPLNPDHKLEDSNQDENPNWFDPNSGTVQDAQAIDPAILTSNFILEPEASTSLFKNQKESAEDFIIKESPTQEPLIVPEPPEKAEPESDNRALDDELEDLLAAQKKLKVQKLRLENQRIQAELESALNELNR